MSEKSFNQSLEDEITLKDIIDFLMKSWKVIALSGIVGGFWATGYAFSTTPKYQVTASFQVAKVAGSDVENPILLFEKLKMPTYYSTESYSACDVSDTIDPGEAIVKKLKPIISKNLSIINISLIAESSENAQKCLVSVLNEVRNNQNLLAKPILERKKNQLMNLKQKLDAAERVFKNLPNKNSSFELSDSNFSASAFLLAASLNKENEIADLHTQINDLENALLDPQTRETLLVVPIYAPKQKVSPNHVRILMGGVIAGLFLGLIFMIGKLIWVKHKDLN